ncbi:MAG: efflux RND transporter periplasmic adaptor subunit [Chitinophagales bacterium]|nr:efflux RND transporter periplasmic adaptor subunit [Chitinophagales bacterium]
MNFKNLLIIFIIILSNTQCKHSHSHDDEHGHTHAHDETSTENELEPLVYTIYADNVELFVEFKPLVVNNSTSFATHLTILGDEFKPMLNGSVSLTLQTNNETISIHADTISSPGIYRLSLQPKKAGNGQLVFEVKTKTFTNKIIIDDVEVYPNEATALKNQKVEDSKGEISYLKEQAWLVPFANEVVHKKMFYSIIHTSGVINNFPGNEAKIVANASGIVHLTNKNLIVGMPVSANQNLFTIAGDNLTTSNIDANYKINKTIVDEAKLNYQRAEELYKLQIISEKEYLQSKTSYENALVTLNTLSKNTSSKGNKNMSPMSGYLQSLDVVDGQFVELGTTLAKISKNNKLILQANISQKDFKYIPLINNANFKIMGDDKVYNTKTFNGKVVSYNKEISGAFIPLYFEINNTDKLHIGAIVELFIPTKPEDHYIIIPLKAIIEEQGKFFVYVQVDGENFSKREIKIGEDNGIEAQVLSGLNVGERIVTKGAYQIKLAVASGAMPEHGHSH